MTEQQRITGGLDTTAVEPQLSDRQHVVGRIAGVGTEYVVVAVVGRGAPTFDVYVCSGPSVRKLDYRWESPTGATFTEALSVVADRVESEIAESLR